MAKDALVRQVRGAESTGRALFPRTLPVATPAISQSPFLALLMSALLLALGAPSAAQETWTPTSTVGAPSARVGHTTVWTGSEMIVWGGEWSDFVGTNICWNTGGRYDPATDTWTPTSTVGAPSARGGHTAVWTGSKMIVWGGQEASGEFVSTGGIYDPATDTWSAMGTVGAPSARFGHTAVWTGSKMIIWGGGGVESGGADVYFNTGAMYDPLTDTWTPTSTVGAPAARVLHTATWTGSKMIVWGGWGGQSTPAGSAFLLNTGGMYDPAHDTWTPTSTVGAPAAREYHTAVWAGSRMIIWGGSYSEDVGDWPQWVYLNTGAAYSPSTDTWIPTSTVGAPVTRVFHTAVSTGSKMVIWGGYTTDGVLVGTGGIYEPGADMWTPTIADVAPSARYLHQAVWTGSEMIVWGGEGYGMLNTGGVYSYPAVLLPPPSAGFFTVNPCRVIDTRNPRGPVGGPALPANSIRSFPVSGGVCGIPSTAIAVSVNLTAVGPATGGHLTLFPGSASGPPLASNVCFSSAQTRASNALVPLATDGTGTIKVKNGSTGTVHLVLDVNGYFQ